MADPSDPILPPEGLGELDAPLLCDARSGPKGREAYEAGHLSGAVHCDLDRHLSAPVSDAARGGRHPLPDVQAWCAQLGRWGLTPERPVVAYDDQGGANAAARLWWLLRALGHRQVWVLDGGYAAALKQGLPISQQEPDLAPAPPYPAQGMDHMPQVDASEVERARQDPDRCVIDVRAANRYRGEHEPIDPVAGHIPGALNLPLSQNLDAEGRFKSAQALRALYAPVLGDRPSRACVVHCGSGVTACHTLLALERAGLTGAALYVGSWSEWCRNPWPRAQGGTATG